MKQQGGETGNTNSVLLNSLSTDERNTILKQCVRRRFSRESQVVRQLDQDSNIYFVESGVLGVAQFSVSGKEVSYNQLYSGDNFGEISAIDGRPRSASVTALTDSEVTVMPFDVFQSLFSSGGAPSIALMKQLTSMVRRLSERVYEFSTLSVSNRIHAELLRLAREHIDLDGVARISSPPTHAQLASRVSCNREAVRREMKKLEKLGLVTKSDKRWIIPDIDALQRMVDDVHRL
ncbi:MAG: Crp/Fnr family transcriptional regulator [bacterium]